MRNAKLHRSIPKYLPDQTCAIRKTAKTEHLQQSQNTPLPVHFVNGKLQAVNEKSLQLVE
jgi:hypothetical protein